MTTENHLNEFIQWAKENAIEIRAVDPQYDGDNIDLKSITSTIGDKVQIVAISEGKDFLYKYLEISSCTVFNTILNDMIYTSR